jgi:hypothetical protein
LTTSLDELVVLTWAVTRSKQLPSGLGGHSLAGPIMPVAASPLFSTLKTQSLQHKSCCRQPKDLWRSLQGVDVKHAGLATHYIPSSLLPEVQLQLHHRLPGAYWSALIAATDQLLPFSTNIVEG